MILSYISKFTYDIIIGIFDIFLMFLLVTWSAKLFKNFIKETFNLKK
jgi:hypothetical protein